MQGYEEVHVPALKPKEFAAGEKLMPIADLPGWAQPAFNGMQTLNRVQSRVADMALFGVDNMLLCAPTGAGKTNVAMLAILHELGQNMNEDGTINLANFKVVYVAPMKVTKLFMPDLLKQSRHAWLFLVLPQIMKPQFKPGSIVVTRPYAIWLPCGTLSFVPVRFSHDIMHLWFEPSIWVQQVLPVFL